MATGANTPTGGQSQVPLPNRKTPAPQQTPVNWKDPFLWLSKNTGSLTSWIQVIALIVGGIWAYRRYIRVDEPSLEPTARLELHAGHPQEPSPVCRVDLRVVIHNEGHVPFDIKKVWIGGWHSEIPQPTADNPAYFDVNAMERGKNLLFVKNPPDLVLNKHYAPNSNFDQSFTYVFKRLEGLNVFRVEIYDSDKKDAKPLAFARDWDIWNCPAAH